jgi:hypothetical protein
MPQGDRSPRSTGRLTWVSMCVQCVAQGAPFIGAAVTILNRRNLKRWAVRLVAAGPSPRSAPGRDGVEGVDGVDGATDLVPERGLGAPSVGAAVRRRTAGDRVDSGL